MHYKTDNRNFISISIFNNIFEYRNNKIYLISKNSNNIKEFFQNNINIILILYVLYKHIYYIIYVFNIFFSLCICLI